MNDIFRYDDLDIQNEFILIKIIEIYSEEKFYSSIKIQVWNKTSEILNLHFNDYIFLTFERIEIPITKSALSNEYIRILPNTGKTHNVYLSEKKHQFHEGDFLISTFTIKNQKYVLGNKISHLAKPKEELRKKPIPLNQNTKPQKSIFTNCLIIIAFFIIALFTLIIFMTIFRKS